MAADEVVPDDVESLLIEIASGAGAIGGSLGGGAAGRAGGASGAASAATRMKTKTATEVVPFDGDPAEVVARCADRLPQVVEVPGPPDRVRLIVPVGRTGLQQIVVDVVPDPSAAGAAASVTVRAYGKEGVLSRKPTARTAAAIAAALAGPG